MMQRGGNRENAGDDWRVGDWAECVDDSWHIRDEFDPKVGDRLMVSAVVSGFLVGTPIPAVGLAFIGKPKGRGWDVASFRKIISDREEPKRLAGVPEPVA